MWQKVEDQSHWDKIIGLSAHSRFLQSWSWGKFQESLGRKVLRLSWHDEAFVQTIKMSLPGGFAYWYIPHGPSVVAPEAWDELIKMLGEHGALFLRVDPILELATLAQYGASPARQIIPSTQPQCTLVMDLSLSSERLLASMHQKTRYNINLAEKKGVIVKAGTIDNFLQLNKQTTGREKFVSHPDNYYRQMVKVLSDGVVKIWRAGFNDKVLASALVIYFGDTATYVHGASANEDRNLMAPYLLHWKIIQDAQKQGYNYYDLGGVNPTDENHLAYKKFWQGITRFKAGFGGEFVSNPPSFDLIYRSGWYRLYGLSKSLKRLLV